MKALASLHICAGSHEPSMLKNTKSHVHGSLAVYSTTHCADKLPPRGCKQIQMHSDSNWIIDFLRL